MDRIRNSDFWDRRISWYIVLFFIVQALNSAIKTVFPISGDLWNRLSLFWGAISIVYLLFFCIKEVMKRVGKIAYGIIIIFAFLYFISILFAYSRGESTNVILSFSALWCFSWWIPVGICACSINNYKILYSVFVRSSYIILIVLLVWFLGRNNISTNKEYNMGFGFQIVLPTLIHMSEYYLKRKWYYLILILAELLMILLYANRGALLCVVFFIVFIIFFSNLNIKRKILLVAAIGTMVLFFIASGDAFLNSVSLELERNGINSRTITMMNEHNMEYDTGRSSIWKCSKNMMMEKPVLGWGIGGEYYELTVRCGGTYGESIIGTHNMLIQFFVEFGLVIGFVLCLYIIMPIFKLHKIRDIYKFLILVVCYCAAVAPCLFTAAEPMQKPAIAIFLFIFYGKNRRTFIKPKVRRQVNV